MNYTDILVERLTDEGVSLPYCGLLSSYAIRRGHDTNVPENDVYLHFRARRSFPYKIIGGYYKSKSFSAVVLCSPVKELATAESLYIDHTVDRRLLFVGVSTDV